MNERITKIVIETLGKEGVIDSRAFGHWALSDEQLEKFAELIVKECANFVENIFDDDGGHTPCEDYAKGIKKHFGVEE